LVEFVEQCPLPMVSKSVLPVVFNHEKDS